MRTVTYRAACSLDGFIAGLDGSLDWLHFSRDVSEVMATYWATADTILMGRKTWEVAAKMGGGGGGGMPGITGTFVFSRTLKSIKGRDVTLVRDDARDFVRELKTKPGKGICVMGGGELASALFAAGLIDEVGLNIHPVILGTGIPFFRDPGRRVSLTLVENRTIDGGCVLATYRAAS
jgi:dihydrofolate reductase